MNAAGVEDRARDVLASGAAADRFQAWLRAQGATGRVPEDLPRAPVVRRVAADGAGWLAGIDAERVGQAVVDLGGGRKTKADAIDPRVGVVLRTEVGMAVEVGTPLVEIHAADEATARRAEDALSFLLADAPVAPVPALIETL